MQITLLAHTMLLAKKLLILFAFHYYTKLLLTSYKKTKPRLTAAVFFFDNRAALLLKKTLAQCALDTKRVKCQMNVAGLSVHYVRLLFTHIGMSHLLNLMQAGHACRFQFIKSLADTFC